MGENGNKHKTLTKADQKFVNLAWKTFTLTETRKNRALIHKNKNFLKRTSRKIDGGRGIFTFLCNKPSNRCFTRLLSKSEGFGCFKVVFLDKSNVEKIEREIEID